MAQSHERALITDTKPATEHLHGFTCAPVTPNNHVSSKIPHSSAPMSLVELCFAKKSLLWKRRMIYKTKTSVGCSAQNMLVSCASGGELGHPALGEQGRACSCL